mgnify:CR=1 FL=1
MLFGKIMKPALKTSILIISMLVVGFILGRLHGILTRGYVYNIIDQKSYDSPSGSVEWRHVTKAVGFPFLDPGTTELEYDGRLLFSALRVFQEDSPFARDVQFDGKRLQWDDGDYSYSLEIKGSKYRKEPNQTPEPTPTAVTPDADASVVPSAGAARLQR